MINQLIAVKNLLDKNVLTYNPRWTQIHQKVSYCKLETLVYQLYQNKLNYWYENMLN